MTTIERRAFIRRWLSEYGIKDIDEATGEVRMNVMSPGWEVRTAPWCPDKGSKAHDEAYGIAINQKGKPLKAHWVDSKQCHVVADWQRDMVMDRILRGDGFNDVPSRKRCKICDREFQNG